MARPKREQLKKEVMVRLEPEVYELAEAVKALTRQSFQSMLEPVITKWLRQEWADEPAVETFLRSREALTEHTSGVERQDGKNPI